jgi:hypothetical protein
VFDLTGVASEEERSDLLATAERYCVVLQTLAHSPELTVLPGPTAPPA